MAKLTLEQERAKYAWERVQGCSKDYTNLAKAAPALIMNSGLMQALAFFKSKDKDHHRALIQHLCAWLRTQRIVREADFATVMQSLHGANPATHYPAVPSAGRATGQVQRCRSPTVPSSRWRGIER